MPCRRTSKTGAHTHVVNCHRIHYDLDYARNVEGCPGLLVHSPLTMILMLDLFRREIPDARGESFDLRAVAQVYDTMDFSIHGAPGDEPEHCKLWAMTCDGALAMTADVLSAAGRTSRRRFPCGFPLHPFDAPHLKFATRRSA